LSKGRFDELSAHTVDSMNPRILVRPPSPQLADGQLTHLARAKVDAGRAREQWEQYVEAFRTHGWAVTEVEPADEFPDGVFVEDTVVIFDDLAVLTSPGAHSRVGEVATTERALTGLAADGIALELARISLPGHLDGGDVLKIDTARRRGRGSLPSRLSQRTAYVGASSRTDDAGIAQLRSLVEPRGWTVVPVPVRRVLHLKSAVTALPDGTVIGHPANVEPDHRFPEFLPVPEEPGTAVVDLGGGAVLMSAAAPQTRRLLEARGLEVVPTPIGEFEKLEGCVTCLSVRLR
jgi:dimethylargininase